MTKTLSQLKPGQLVRVPWGLEDPRQGKILEVWGDPPLQVRVEIEPGEDGEESAVILLNARIVDPIQ